MTLSDNEKRGMVIISSLINFADWLYEKGILAEEFNRGQLVREFLESHSHEKNYFKSTDEIHDILGIPFEGEQP